MKFEAGKRKGRREKTNRKKKKRRKRRRGRRRISIKNQNGDDLQMKDNLKVLKAL